MARDEVGINSTEGNGKERSGDGGPPEPSRDEMALEREEEEPGNEANGYGGRKPPLPTT